MALYVQLWSHIQSQGRNAAGGCFQTVLSRGQLEGLSPAGNDIVQARYSLVTYVRGLVYLIFISFFFFFIWGIRKLKLQLQQLRWKGAGNVSHEYQERSCARCQKSLGLLMNRGAVCNGCSHRVCSECRVCLNACLWKCTVCYAHG